MKYFRKKSKNNKFVITMGLTNIKKKEVVYWETKDGKKLNIDEMSIEHLRNIVKNIAKQRELNDDDDNWMGYFGDEFWKY